MDPAAAAAGALLLSRCLTPAAGDEVNSLSGTSHPDPFQADASEGGLE